MSTRLRSIVLFMAILSPFWVMESPLTLAQPTTVNIATVRPPSIQIGTVVAVEGGPFQSHEGNTGTTIWFPDFNAPLSTYVESSSRLVFFIPAGTPLCGEQQMVARTYINLNNQESFFDSNPVVIDVDCPTGTGAALARPRINLLSILTGLNGEKTLRIEGSQIIPNALADELIFGNSDPSPRTEVRIYNSNFDETYFAQYTKYEEAEVELPNNFPCGEFTVELRNYDGSDFSDPSLDQGRSTLRHTINCDENTGVLEPGEDVGPFIVDRIELPNTIYSGERFQGSVYVKLAGSVDVRDIFIAQYELELYLDGDLRDTIRLDLSEFTNGSSEGKGFPFAFTLQRTGSHEIEARVRDSDKMVSFDVMSENGTAPPPTQGGDELYEYDSDNNCELSDTEFFVLLDGWLSGSASDILFFSGVDAWIGGSNVCPVSVSAGAISLSASTDGLSVESNTSLGAVNIYDSNGREVFTQITTRNILVWNLRTTDGNALANGVYFVSIANTGELRKVMLLR